jgi:hypothetical protein
VNTILSKVFYIIAGEMLVLAFVAPLLAVYSGWTIPGLSVDLTVERLMVMLGLGGVMTIAIGFSFTDVGIGWLPLNLLGGLMLVGSWIAPLMIESNGWSFVDRTSHQTALFALGWLFCFGGITMIVGWIPVIILEPHARMSAGLGHQHKGKGGV